MSQMYVTPAQVLAAKLALELSQEAGESPDEALEAIVNARVIHPQQSSRQRASTNERAPSEATLQRIEHQLQLFNSQASAQRRPQPPDPTPVTANPQGPQKRPWDRDDHEETETRNVNPPQSERVGDRTGGEREVGANARVPPVSLYVPDSDMSDERADWILRENEEQRERQREQEQGHRDETPDPGTDRPRSEGR
jgi:hypothetical protein